MLRLDTVVTWNPPHPLVLGQTQQALHPITLIQFPAGPIALIRQKTPNNKPLIIGGKLKDWQNLHNSPIEINKYAFQHIQFTDFQQNQNPSGNYQPLQHDDQKHQERRRAQKGTEIMKKFKIESVIIFAS